MSKVKSLERAIEYLDSCGEFTLEKFTKAHKIAKSGVPKSQLKQVWDNMHIEMKVDAPE